VATPGGYHVLYLSLVKWKDVVCLFIFELQFAEFSS